MGGEGGDADEGEPEPHHAGGGDPVKKAGDEAEGELDQSHVEDNAPSGVGAGEPFGEGVGEGVADGRGQHGQSGRLNRLDPRPEDEQ